MKTIEQWREYFGRERRKEFLVYEVLSRHQGICFTKGNAGKFTIEEIICLCFIEFRTPYHLYTIFHEYHGLEDIIQNFRKRMISIGLTDLKEMLDSGGRFIKHKEVFGKNLEK